MPCGCVLLAYAGLSFLDGQPRTIHFQIDRWENNSWGFHNVERDIAGGTVAISSDGSRSNVLEFESRKFYFISQGHFRSHSLYRRRENIGYRIDDQARTVHPVPCSCTWTPAELRQDDPDCSQTASAYFNGKRISYATVAGISVVRYRLVDESTSEEMALAPLLGCDIMDHERTTFNDFGLPTSYYHLAVTTYVPGEPDPVLMMLPQGYQIVEKRR